MPALLLRGRLLRRPAAVEVGLCELLLELVRSVRAHAELGRPCLRALARDLVRERDGLPLARSRNDLPRARLRGVGGQQTALTEEAVERLRDRDQAETEDVSAQLNR